MKITTKSNSFFNITFDLAVCGFEVVNINLETNIKVDYSLTSGSITIALAKYGSLV